MSSVCRRCSSSNIKGTVVFYFPFLKFRVCICALYIRALDKGGSKPAPKRAFNVLRKTTSRSALLSFPAGTFVFWCETGVDCFMRVWFTRITSLMHKRINRVYVIPTSICAIVASRLLWCWFDPTETGHVLMADCLCKYFHSEVAEGCVSRWPSRFLWHSKTFQLRILLLFSAREPPITLMHHQTCHYHEFDIHYCGCYIPYQDYDDFLKFCFYLFRVSFCRWCFSYVLIGVNGHILIKRHRFGAESDGNLKKTGFYESVQWCMSWLILARYF